MLAMLSADLKACVELSIEGLTPVSPHIRASPPAVLLADLSVGTLH